LPPIFFASPQTTKTLNGRIDTFFRKFFLVRFGEGDRAGWRCLACARFDDIASRTTSVAPLSGLISEQGRLIIISRISSPDQASGAFSRRVTVLL
ncbi:MAG: hypothetical protein WD872_08165, partial [Pirellulaceae bacterium]